MLGEFELIARLRERIAAAGAASSPDVLVASGDDAAVVEPRGVSATSVDTVVDGVHFRRSTFGPEAIGRKALAAALSDLAAMGAEAGEAYVQLGIPADLAQTDLDGIADGMAATAVEAGAAIAGGDIVSSPVLFVAVTVVGYGPSADQLVTRAGARPGDVVLLTGALGGAAAGLLLLERDDLLDVSEDVAAPLRERQLEPRPRLKAGIALARAGARAMIDISDGLAADAGHVAAASDVRLELDLAENVGATGVEEVAAAAGIPASDLVAGGGEDYELLACIPPDRIGEAVAAVRATTLDPVVCGRVERGEGLVLRGAKGRVSVPGFDQLRPQARGGRSRSTGAG